MADKQKKKKQQEEAASPEVSQASEDTAAAESSEPESEPEQNRILEKTALAEKEEQYLRLVAEYDNYRKRTQKEKENLWTEAKVQTISAFLSVYDNLERALKQDTEDKAFAKGVDMTMKGFQDALTKLGVEQIPALGEVFDPNRHNAIMHVEDEDAEENTVVEVFQQGFICGDKVIRCSMVKVAN